MSGGMGTGCRLASWLTMASERQRSSDGSEVSLTEEDEPLRPLPDPDEVENEEQAEAAVEVRNTEATARRDSKQVSRGRSGSRDSRIRKEHNVKRESVAKQKHSEVRTRPLAWSSGCH